jgi:hypothetical protein
VGHFAAHPAIEAWAAENEPYLPSGRASNWGLSRDYVQELIAVIRAHDPQGRPVVVTDGQAWGADGFEHRFAAFEDADVFGISLYPYRRVHIPGADEVVFPIVKLGPFQPNIPHHAEQAREAGDEYWITELQAEPWGRPDVREFSPENPPFDVTVERLAKNIEYGRRSGASRVYLWGAEYWLFQAEKHGDASYLDVVRDVIAGTPDSAAAAAARR